MVLADRSTEVSTSGCGRRHAPQQSRFVAYPQPSSFCGGECHEAARHAQTCPHCRSLIVSKVMGGQPAASVARDFQVSTKTVRKWIARFRACGRAGLDDRSSRPHHIAQSHLQPGNELSDAVFALLHTPPRDSGFNRTTWRLADLHSALKTRVRAISWKALLALLVANLRSHFQARACLATVPILSLIHI